MTAGLGCSARRLAVGFALTVNLVACALTVRERGQVGWWLSCTECDEGQLDSVVALGRKWHKRAAVVRELRRVALEIPFTGGFAQELARSYEADSLYVVRVTGAPPRGWPSRSAWVVEHLENRVAVRRLRALRALERVDTTGARWLSVLDSMSVRPQRAEVRVLVERLRLRHP